MARSCARCWPPRSFLGCKRLVPDRVTVIGGGLSGCEAAWQLAERGISVSLVEMKPLSLSPAHQTPLLCELVCSNSLRGDEPSSGAGLLKHELRRAGSLVIRCADEHRVPAGSALAVERVGFARAVTTALALHPNIRIERRVLDRIPTGQVVIASGPLTGGGLAAEIRGLFASEDLYFYDAIAPIVAADSIDLEHAFTASRWDKGDSDRGDYINCPVDRDNYYGFVDAVLAARKVVPHGFEKPKFFEGCLPIEVMAERGADVLRYGPMRPVGLTDPTTGKWPFAVIQLRAENNYLSAYNLVGFQTRMAYPEQKRIFSMVPALANAEFLRFGSVHRNTFINGPRLLGSELQLRDRPEICFAGLIAGVEGYIESCALGLLSALFLAGRLSGRPIPPPPATTAFGGLYHHVTRPRQASESYSPSNINFGLLPRCEVRAKKSERKRMVAARAIRDFAPWSDSVAPTEAA